MTQLDKLRSMTVEEVAKGRVRFDLATTCYFGDFGTVSDSRMLEGRTRGQSDYAEALRREIAWLESEVIGETEGEK